MPKLPSDFLLSLPLRTTHNRYSLWQEISLDLNLRRNNDEQISFLNKRESEIINKLKKEGGDFILLMIEEGKFNSYSAKSFEEQFVKFIIDYDFAVKTIHKVQPYIAKIEQIRNHYSSRPAFIIDKKILSNCKELYELPIIKYYVTALPYLQHLDNIHVTMEKLKHKRAIVNYIPEDGLKEKFIKEEIETLSDNGWKDIFIDEGDYNLFCDLLVRYFEVGDCLLPDVTIHLQTGWAYKFAKATKPILKKFCKNMRRARGFYNIFRLLADFKEKDDETIYNILRK